MIFFPVLENWIGDSWNNIFYVSGQDQRLLHRYSTCFLRTRWQISPATHFWNTRGSPLKRGNLLKPRWLLLSSLNVYVEARRFCFFYANFKPMIRYPYCIPHLNHFVVVWNPITICTVIKCQEKTWKYSLQRSESAIFKATPYD